ncbi:MAG TPA: ABC transporter permease subunit [Pseudonocardia sp.]|nr:ABC transporter permease subunit [Pseudonocardia sp.]
MSAPVGAGPSRRWMRWAVLVLIGGYLVLPLVAMLDFSTQAGGGRRSLDAWAAIGTSSELLTSIWVSLQLAALTVLGMLVLLVPTMAWVHLRLPHLRRTVEFLCLLPLTIPAIVLVVGLAPIYAWVSYLLGNSPLTLALAFVVLTLPFAYRAIDAGLSAIDVITLAEAARSLGASWTGVLLRIVVPNIRGAIMSAAVISVALVLGEFTIASLLNYDTLQVVIFLLGKRNAEVSVAVALAALVFAFVLLFVLAGVAPRRGGSRADQEEITTKGLAL